MDSPTPYASEGSQDAGKAGKVDGEALVTALKMQEEQRAIMEGPDGIERSYRGICTSASGESVVSGLQLGNVWIGVQPALGLEGDPMRLLFQRDLTPHPQYAAFYTWLQHTYKADAVLHFGMHGTVEWLPGAPLGNSGFSWSDVLLGDMPNIYVYACNNPSETIVAKRRGYGTIISHNVPPYGRAGLYKQLAELKNVVSDYRENPKHNAALKGPIIELLAAAGLEQDCPFRNADGAPHQLSPEAAEGVADETFAAYASELNTYLQVMLPITLQHLLQVYPPGPPAVDWSLILSRRK
ncbi:hypothetical protein WJX84_011696 [Apatococcus fuscideae]|uniref:CobN/magnesium chelatase domain-containing protein n=1 Tax=Apatococcus fuscideae TaxID=2026836 RepID=A0AAW1SX36_9CHLO